MVLRTSSDRDRCLASSKAVCSPSLFSNIRSSSAHRDLLYQDATSILDNGEDAELWIRRIEQTHQAERPRKLQVFGALKFSSISTSTIVGTSSLASNLDLTDLRRRRLSLGTTRPSLQVTDTNNTLCVTGSRGMLALRELS